MFFLRHRAEFPSHGGVVGPLAALGVFGGGRSFFGGGELRLEFRLLLGPLRRSRVHVHRGVFLGGRLGGGDSLGRLRLEFRLFLFPSRQFLLQLRRARLQLCLRFLPLLRRDPLRVVQLEVFFRNLQLRRGLISLGGDRGEFLDRLLRRFLCRCRRRREFLLSLRHRRPRRRLRLVQRLLHAGVLGDVHLSVLIQKLLRARLPALGVRLEELALAGGALRLRLGRRRLLSSLLLRL